jgi:hypothetical protein
MFRQTRAASRGFPGLAAGNDTNAVRKIVEAEIQQNDEDSAEADCRCVNGMAVLGTPRPSDRQALTWFLTVLRLEHSQSGLLW